MEQRESNDPDIEMQDEDAQPGDRSVGINAIHTMVLRAIADLKHQAHAHAITHAEAAQFQARTVDEQVAAVLEYISPRQLYHNGELPDEDAIKQITMQVLVGCGGDVQLTATERMLKILSVIRAGPKVVRKDCAPQMWIGDPLKNFVMDVGDWRDVEYTADECYSGDSHDPAWVPNSPPIPALDRTANNHGRPYPVATQPQRTLHDKRYLTGLSDTIIIDHLENAKRRQDAASLAVHPAFHLTSKSSDEDGRPIFCDDPTCLRLDVPGQYEMVPGIPIRMQDKDDPAISQTFGCVHTIATLEQLPGLPHRTEVREWATCIGKILFGDESSNTRPFVEHMFKPNLRDKGVHPGRYDGSFSLATTLGEGEGKGNVQPAKQIDSLEANEARRQLCMYAARLATAALKGSITKSELEVLLIRGEANNVPGFGHEENLFFTSLQGNFSSASPDLQAAIGAESGGAHTDCKDCAGSWTSFLLFYKLPHGSAPGAFVFAENGWYVARLQRLYGDVYIVIVVFKARHLHHGLGPLVSKLDSEIHEMLQRSDGIIRVGLVAYPNSPSMNRTASTFSSFASDTDRNNQSTFIQHGGPAMGTPFNLYRFLMREAAYRAFDARSSIAHASNGAIDPPNLQDEFPESRGFCDPVTKLFMRFEPPILFRPDLDPAHCMMMRLRVLTQIWVGRYFDLDITKREIRDARSKARQKEEAIPRIPEEVPDLPETALVDEVLWVTVMLDQRKPDDPVPAIWLVVAANHGIPKPGWVKGGQWLKANGPAILDFIRTVYQSRVPISSSAFMPSQKLLLPLAEPADQSQTGDAATDGCCSNKDKKKSQTRKPKRKPKKQPIPDLPSSEDDEDADKDGKEPEQDSNGDDNDDNGTTGAGRDDDPPPAQMLARLSLDSSHPFNDPDLSSEDESSATFTSHHQKVQAIFDGVLRAVRERAIVTEINHMVVARLNAGSLLSADYSQMLKDLAFVNGVWYTDSAISDCFANSGSSDKYQHLVRQLDHLRASGTALAKISHTSYTVNLLHKQLQIACCNTLAMAWDLWANHIPSLVSHIFRANPNDPSSIDVHKIDVDWVDKMAADILQRLEQEGDGKCELRLTLPADHYPGKKKKKAAQLTTYNLKIDALSKGTPLERASTQLTEAVYLVALSGAVTSAMKHIYPAAQAKSLRHNMCIFGAVLQEMKKELFSCDGVWVLDQFKPLWEKAHIILNCERHPERGAKGLMKGITRPGMLPVTLHFFKKQLQALRDEHSDQLKDLVPYTMLLHFQIQELVGGRRLPRLPPPVSTDVSASPNQAVRSKKRGPNAAAAEQPSKKAKLKRRMHAAPAEPFEADSLLPPACHADALVLAAALVQCALHKKRHGDELVSPATDMTRLIRLLLAQNTEDGMRNEGLNEDQLNPIRNQWLSVLELQRGLPGDVVAKPDGLGFFNLLAAVGSGQGLRTKLFLSQWMTCIGILGAPLERCELIKLVYRTEEYNDNMRRSLEQLRELETGQQTTVSDAELTRHAAYNKTSDMRVWGTASTAIGFLPSNARVTTPEGYNHLVARISELFSDEIMETWTTFLEAKNSVGPCPWREAVTWIRKLEIAPFKSESLSSFQLAHHLAMRNLCQHPTVNEMADWIVEHPDLGAFRGLEAMGFNVEDKDRSRVKAALLYLRSHLTKHMSHEDLVDCGVVEERGSWHSMIFIENLLCKIVRVAQLGGRKETRDKLDIMNACRKLLGVHGQPFPTQIDKKELQAWCEKVVEESGTNSDVESDDGP